MADALRSIGVLGGMGPGSTARFLTLLFESFQIVAGAKRNAEFPRLVVITVPNSDNMGAESDAATERELAAGLDFLTKADVDFFVAPCNTVESTISAGPLKPSFLSIVGAVREVARQKLISRRVLLLSTRQTRRSNRYEEMLDGIGSYAIYPDNKRQCEIDQLILDVNGGVSSAELSRSLHDVIAAFDVDVTVLGCTELSLIELDPDVPHVGSLEALAEATFRVSSKRAELSEFYS